MGKEARKFGSCFIPLAIAAAGIMAGRCAREAPPDLARQAPEAVETSDVLLEAALPLHPEIAAAVSAIEDETDLQAALTIDGEDDLEGVRSGVRLGVRAGIRAGRRAEELSGVRLGIRLASQDGVRLISARHPAGPETRDFFRIPQTEIGRVSPDVLSRLNPSTSPTLENRVLDLPKLSSAPASPPLDMASLAFVAQFRIPPDRLPDGAHDLHVRARLRRRPDLSLIEIKKKLKSRARPLSYDSEGSGEYAGAAPAGAIEIEETGAAPDEIDLPDLDADNVVSAVELAARLAGPNRSASDPLEDAYALASNPAAPDEAELRAAFERLAETFREKVRSTAEAAGIPPEEAPNLSWGPADFSAPETAATADRTILRPSDSATVALACSKPKCAFRCSWTFPGGSRAGEACSSPFNFQSDQIGEHRLLVVAVDTFGSRDLSPAEIVFQVVSDLVCVSDDCGAAPPQETPPEPPPPAEDRPVVTLGAGDGVPPDTRLTSAPSRLTRADTATFDFAATEPDSTFACALGLGAAFPCTSPFALLGVKEGGHAFRVFAIDAAGNRDPSPAVYEWLVDRTPPKPGEVAATGPGESGFLRSTDRLFIAWAGFADESAGIDSYAVHVNDRADCSGERQGAANAGLARSAEPGGLNLLDGSIYFACVQATDRAGNAGAWVPSRGLTVDVSEPTSTLLQPPSGAKVSALTAIGGSASDPISGVAGVALTIRREGDGFYWDGKDWRSEPAWNKATGGTSFLFSGVPSWESGVRYVVRSRAADTAGNVESRDTISLFTFDSTPPEFAGATSAASLANAIRVSWSPATDAVSPRLAIRYVVCRSTDASGCTPFNATSVTPPGATQLDFTGLKANTTYYFVVRARDEAGNTDANTVQTSATTGNAN